MHQTLHEPTRKLLCVFKVKILQNQHTVKKVRRSRIMLFKLDADQLQRLMIL